MPSHHSVDVTGFDTVRLRRGVSLAVLGIGVTASGLAIGWDFATGARFTILGPLLLLAGVGYAGAGPSRFSWRASSAPTPRGGIRPCPGNWESVP